MNRVLHCIPLVSAIVVAGLSVTSAHGQTRPVANQAESTELRAFKKAIRTQYDSKEKAWAAQDYKGLVTGFYSPKAFTAAEGEPKFYAQGRERFLELYKAYVADTTKIRVESVHTYVNGNMGWDWTNFHAEVKPEKVKDYPPSPVRILFVWEKIDGKWMCAGDVVLLGTFDTVNGK
jgi:ketosteroid isomerase-like protein